ncbi:MAG TPA: sulfite exporter TauE/SafE family protein, partial [Chthonomonadaceae bacterium]|nr:sulfite exporter TauE/SafE family protein [Chthonomonadaceae bacterium]
MWSVDVGAGHLISLPLLAFVGLFVGYIAGMFGVGGGILLMPVLLYGFRVPEVIAIGSSLCQQCGTSLASFLKYRRLKRGEPRIDLLMIGGSLIGVDAGTRTLEYLSHLAEWRIGSGHPVAAVRVVLDVGYVGLLTFTAWFTFREAWLARRRAVPRGDRTIPGPLVTHVRIPPFVDLPNVQLKQVSVPMIAAVGFSLGFFSGMMGLGGGILFMPIMLYGFGLSLRNAAGTGVLLLFVT